MHLIAIDTETYLIKDNNIPAPICLSAYAQNNGKHAIYSFVSGFSKELYDWLVKVLSDEQCTIIMHNAAFDLSVICNAYPTLYPYAFKALDAGRIQDTKIIEKLHKIANGGDGSGRYENGAGKLSLAGLVYKYFDTDIYQGKKDANAIRYHYDSLRDIPVDQWEDEAKKYALEDAMWTLLIYCCQIKQIDHEEINNQVAQVKADFCLRLMGSHGIRVDSSKVDQVEQNLKQALEEASKPLISCGFLDSRGKENKETIKRTIEKAYATRGGTSKKTVNGGISLDKQALEESKHPDCLFLLEYRESEKLLSTYIDSIKMVNSDYLDNRLRCEYEVLQSTGRTSSKDPNLQNLPRREGIRDCFVPSEGFIFIACDYDAAELRTLAQCYYSMTGIESPLLQWYKRDPSFDPHTWFACKMMNITYEEGMNLKKQGDKTIKANRQRAKACNFGFPGGMGHISFQAYAKGYGLNLSEEEALDLKNQWFEAWDMTGWTRLAAKTIDEVGYVEVPFSQRRRGNVNFTQACNTPFQGLASDGAKEALFLVTKECFSEPKAPLYDCRPVVFIHDEIIIEAPEFKAQEAAKRLQELMIQGMSKYCPDCPIEASPTLMRYWSKNAESSEENGFFTIWG